MCYRSPFLLAGQRYGYMIFTIPMTNVLANLYNTTKAELGIVNIPGISGGELQANKIRLQPMT